MTTQLSVAVRNARLDVIETTAGTSAKLRFYSGAKPADCATARSGTLLCEIALPSDWEANASGGVKTMTGSWAGVGAVAGDAGHFALMDSAGTTCHMQGSVTATGGGGDLTLDNISIAVGQAVAITSWVMTEGNA